MRRLTTPVAAPTRADEPPLPARAPLTQRSPSGPHRRWQRRHAVSWWVVGPVVVYLLLSVLGITQSSVGIGMLRQDPAAATPDMLGPAQGIRSDEFLTSTPLAIGVTATGSTQTQNPLVADDGFFSQLPSGPVSSLVLFDGAALRLGPVLPDEMLVAARWWLPFLLIALAAPAFFRDLTGSRLHGLFAASLLVLSPASAWWSYTPVAILGFALAGTAALLRSANTLGAGRRWRAVAWGVLSAVLLARTPLQYQPWAIVLTPVVLLVGIAGLLAARERRRTHLVAVLGTGLGALVLLAGVVVENIDSIRASLGTLYPGARLSTGSPSPLAELFGATSLGSLTSAELVGTNQSEISSSFTIAGVWLLLLVAHGLAYRDRTHRWAVLTATAGTAAWFAWAFLDFGTWGAQLPVVNRVPAFRAADVVGYLAVLGACLALPALTAAPRRGFAALAGASTFLVAAHAGSVMRATVMPNLSTRDVWLSSLLLGAIILWVTLRPRAWVPYVAAVALAALLVWRVNPFLFGLGDLRGGPLVAELQQAGDQARDAGTVWATDNNTIDPLLIANGVPALSGRQLAGPDREAWLELDPSGSSEPVWNRGGSYITFQWTESDELTFSNPSLDMIAVTGSPCAVAARLPALTTVVSSRELVDPCLEPADSFLWGGATRWVYEVDGAKG